MIVFVTSSFFRDVQSHREHGIEVVLAGGNLGIIDHRFNYWADGVFIQLSIEDTFFYEFAFNNLGVVTRFDRFPERLPH